MTTRRRSVAIILALAFGMLGVHKFFLNEPKQGVLYFLLSTIGSVLLFLGPILTFIFTFIDIVNYLLLSDDEFDIKY